MNQKTKSIRPFIGAKNFEISRNFYRDLGFKEITLGANMSVFKLDDLAFYLQDYYLQDWIDNTMLFLEVENVDSYFQELLALDLTNKYENVKITPVKKFDWGKEGFLHDPSGVLWHIGEFSS